MSPEAKAREIAREWYVSFADPKNDIRFFSANMRADFVEKQIVQALRDVERETLERAAKIADEAAIARRRDVTDWTGNEADPFACTGWEYAADEADEIAHSIRSLLQKEGG